MARGFKKSKCRWCHADIFWMPHVRTAKMAPIDWDPVPGGNIVPDFTAGTYSVLAGVDRDIADPTVLDEDANPTLFANHWSSCTSTHAHRPSTLAEVPKVGADWAAGPDN